MDAAYRRPGAAALYDEGRALERENQTLRAAQKACEDCDAPTMAEIAALRERVRVLEAALDELDRALVPVGSAYTATGMDAWPRVAKAIIAARAALTPLPTAPSARPLSDFGRPEHDLDIVGRPLKPGT